MKWKLPAKPTILLIFVAIFFVAGMCLKIREYWLPTSQIKIAGQTLTVEVAKTPRAIIKGLSGRGSLAKDHGMLFVMPTEDLHVFWMKEMKFPIDIIWINNGRVVDIAPNVPAPQPGEELAQYPPREPARGVLEVKAGFSEKYGLKIGDSLELLTN